MASTSAKGEPPTAERRVPLLAITMGDPAGVGPEIAVKAVADERVQRACRPLLVGSAEVIAEAARIVGSAARIVPFVPPILPIPPIPPPCVGERGT